MILQPDITSPDIAATLQRGLARPPRPARLVTPSAAHHAKPRPRVLFLDHVGVLGGAEFSLLDMVHGTKNDHVVLMSDGPLRSMLQNDGVGVTLLNSSAGLSNLRQGGGPMSAIRAIPQVLWLAQKISRLAVNYDVVWANSQKSFVIGSLAAAWARRPLVWHLRDILDCELFSPVNRKTAVFLANHFAHRVVTVSNAGMQSFINCGGREDLATVVHNGIDPAAFQNVDPADARADLRREFQIGDAPLVGAFGRLAPWKGQHMLIHAMASLPGVHAVIVGESLFGETEYSNSLRNLAVNLRVADRVHFTGFRQDIPQLMAAVDLVALTSTAPEPFGRVIVEAMLAQRPVIATNAGGVPEIITHEQNGLLIPPNDPVLLSMTIRDLLAHPEYAANLAGNGFETALTRFSLTRFLGNIEGVKSQAVLEHPVAPRAVTVNPRIARLMETGMV